MPNEPDGKEVNKTVVVPDELADLPLPRPGDPDVQTEPPTEPDENAVIDHAEIPASPQD